jgi:2-amino-4-hydroxy-6-hydroxymethyldihydropteridine diphosphokinase
LSLGSNLEDRQNNLENATAALGPAGVHVRKVSSLYETQPVDYFDQPWFLNCVVQAETELDPQALLHALQGIETLLGRKKAAIPKGPRIIDLDILLYADEAIDTPELQIPHPRMLQRRFVLVPLAEIAPQLRHASWNASVVELLARTPDRSRVRLFR